MGIEIERKFLVSNPSWIPEACSARVVRQGYLSHDPERTVRIRLIGDQGRLTIKGRSAGPVRQEFEYAIPAADAAALLDLCSGHLVEKTRHLVHREDLTWEIDVFSGSNQGLVVAEVELQAADQELTLPDWVGPEVTLDARYFNSALSRKPFADWT